MLLVFNFVYIYLISYFPICLYFLAHLKSFILLKALFEIIVSFKSYLLFSVFLA